MNELLETYRYDGRRFWMNIFGRWLTTSAASILDCLQCNQGVLQKEAMRLRAFIKTASQAIKDDDWWEKVRWFNFTKGCQLFVTLDKIFFCDPYKQTSKRSMKVAAFNEKLKREFPNRGRVPEGAHIGRILCQRLTSSVE